MSTPEIPPLNGRFLSDYDRRFGPSRARRPQRQLDLQATAPASIRPELILGASSLLPFHFLGSGVQRGRGVVIIVRADGACGTGFLVAPDILLTNHHVLPDVATAASALVSGESRRRASGRAWRRPPRSPFEARGLGRLFVTQGELDYTFCSVLGLEDLGIVPMGRDARVIGTSDVVNIIQHPRGRPKEVAIQDNRIVKADRVILHYSCDTEPGSSGSPVFDNQWRLVALHHASIVGPTGRSARAARSQPADVRFLNEGVRLSPSPSRWRRARAGSGPTRRPWPGSAACSTTWTRSPGSSGPSADRATGVARRSRLSRRSDKRRGDTAGRRLLGPPRPGRPAARRLRRRGLGDGRDGPGRLVPLAHLPGPGPRPGRAASTAISAWSTSTSRPRDAATLTVLLRKSQAISAERIEEAGLDVLRVRIRDSARRVTTIRILPIRTGVVAERPGRRDRRDGRGLLLRLAPDRRRPVPPRLHRRHPRRLRSSGLDLIVADAGPDGGFALLRPSGSAVSRLLHLAQPSPATTPRSRSFPTAPPHARLPPSPLAAPSPPGSS